MKGAWRFAAAGFAAIQTATPPAVAEPRCGAIQAVFGLADRLRISHDSTLEQSCTARAQERPRPVAVPAGDQLRTAIGAARYSPGVVEASAPEWLSVAPTQPEAWVGVGVGANLNASVLNAATQISVQLNASVSLQGVAPASGMPDFGALVVGGAAPQLRVLRQYTDASGLHTLVALEQQALQQVPTAVAEAAYALMATSTTRFTEALERGQVTQADREILAQALARMSVLSRSELGRSTSSVWEGTWNYVRRVTESALYCAELSDARFESDDSEAPSQPVSSGAYPSLVSETRLAGTLRCGGAVLSGVPIDVTVDGGLMLPSTAHTAANGGIMVDISSIYGNGRVTVQLNPSIQDLPGRGFLTTRGSAQPASAGFTSTRPADYSLSITGALEMEEPSVREAVANMTQRRWSARPTRGRSASLNATLQLTFAPAVRVMNQVSQPVSAIFFLSSSQGRVFERSLRAAALGATPEAARQGALQQLLANLQRL
jgi:hypothetical protein